MKKFLILFLLVLITLIFAENITFYYDNLFVTEKQYIELIEKEIDVYGEAGINSSDIVYGFIDLDNISFVKIFEFEDLLFTDTKLYKSMDDVYIDIHAKRKRQIFKVSINKVDVVQELPQNAKEINIYDLTTFCKQELLELNFNDRLFSAEKIGSKCMDTINSKILVNSNEDILFSMERFGNITFSIIDRNSDSKDEIIIINTHECRGSGEIFILSIK
ncbi:MAG: hypothetical protein P9L95_06145 [Candidatus Tenebribacter mawsonii]|nr:hypothetical protein [Candidatus Tenebribacter mawsonii]